MKLKCISPKLNFVTFDGEGKPVRVRPGDTFTIGAASVPAKWAGLVTVEDDGKARSAVTNPAGSKTAEAAKARA